MDAVTRPINGTPPETFLARTIYELIFPRVVDYGVAYRIIQSLTVNASGEEGFAIIRLSIDDNPKTKFVAHPIFMDSLFHVAGFIANMKGDLGDAYICNAVGSMQIIPESVDATASYVVYCSNVWLPDEGIMRADTYALQLTNPQRIVAHLKGLQFLRVRFDSFKRVLSLAAGSVVSRQDPDSAEYPKLAYITESSAPPAQLSCHSNIQKPALSAEVMQIVSQTCDIDSMAFDAHTDLASLGVDSLLSIEIFDMLQRAFPHTRLNAQALAFCHTINEIVEELCLKHASDLRGMSSSSTLVSVIGGDDPVIDDEGNTNGALGSFPAVNASGHADWVDILGLVSPAIHAVRDNIGHDIPYNHFTTHTTAGEIQFFASDHYSQTVPGHALVAANALPPCIDPESIVKAFRLGEVPVPIQKSSTAGHFPLFFIHDGSGLISYYDRLSSLGRDVWGIHNPHFVNEIPWPWDSLVSMAAEYASYVLKVNSDSVLIGGKLYPSIFSIYSWPIRCLPGWSFGGVVAFEVARQLLKEGIDARVVLIDSPSPVNHVPLPDSLLDSVINLDTHSSSSGIGRFVKAQFRLNSKVLGEYNPLPADGPFPLLVLLRSREDFQAPGISDIPTWLGNRSNARQAAVGWEGLTGCSISIRDIPGHHFQPFHPAHASGSLASIYVRSFELIIARQIEEVSRQISKGCKYLESL
jgi:acyl carrier protein